MGIETGPIERNGCPKASTEFPSTHVTVPVAERSMSPDRSWAAIAEPGRIVPDEDEGSAEAPEAPDGTAIQPAAWATREKSSPGALVPPKETGRGSGVASPAAGSRNGASSDSRRSENRPAANAESRAEVEVADPVLPPIGTGGPAGTCRMSSMLWMGVIPQMGSLENGHP